MQRQKVNIDEPLRKQIDAETGGLYIRARDNASLADIYSSIDKLEKTRIDVTTLKRFTERFFPFVIMALGLLVMEMVLRYSVFRRLP